MDAQEYESLQKMHLLTGEEVTALQTFHRVKPLIVMKWALSSLKAYMESIGRPDLYAQEFEGLVCAGPARARQRQQNNACRRRIGC